MRAAGTRASNWIRPWFHDEEAVRERQRDFEGLLHERNGGRRLIAPRMSARFL
jgi:hypothetical protein